MPIKLTCPHCAAEHRFGSPYPVPGAEVQCGCGRVLVVSYPPDVMRSIHASGARLSDPVPPDDPQAAPYRPAPTARIPPQGQR